jgi:response regulator RpfG family c-di-GMP phosphodiesterase
MPMNTPSGKRPILVVDDEPEILHSLKGLLRGDFQVHTAGSGAEAVRVLETQAVHLVMTDQRMPQMTGVEFLRHVKSDHPEAMRLIFTGYADVQAVIDAVNQGNVFRYVSKPWNPDELVGVLREAGEEYDRLANRERLLADLKSHEQRCAAFDDELHGERAGTMDPETAARLASLFGESRNLLSRLGEALVRPRPPVPHA